MKNKKCIEEINNELELTDKLFETHEVLFDKIKLSSPDPIELSALAVFLHSFYNGIENIFKRIAKRIDNRIPDSAYWHSELLNQMVILIDERENVISEDLANKLKLYLEFRNFFRHSYSFQIKWEKMKDLIYEINGVYNQFKKEIEVFISKFNG